MYVYKYEYYIKMYIVELKKIGHCDINTYLNLLVKTTVN